MPTSTPPALPFLDHLRAESDRFLAVLEAADPDARVPSCPDWDAEDLLWHLTEVQWFWATVVEDRLQSVEGLEHPDRPADRAALLGFARTQADRLHRVLGATDPATEVYMWAEDRSVGYIRRRQAHEALIHRLDAELTVEEVTPLDPDLAADGVAEALGVMYGGAPAWGSFTGDGRRVRFDPTDRPAAACIVELGVFNGTDPDSGTTYADEADLNVVPTGDAVATVSGTADDLDAWLWHRRDAEALTFTGDVTVLEALRQILATPIT